VNPQAPRPNRLLLEVPPGLRARLRVAALEEERTQAEIVRQALTAWLEQRDTRRRSERAVNDPADMDALPPRTLRRPKRERETRG
jgi:hypothetical protein